MENEKKSDEEVMCLSCLNIWMDGVCPYCKLTGKDVEYCDTCKRAHPVV